MIRPDDRISLDKKLDKSWYINTIHYWIELAVSNNNKKDTALNINAANGVIDEKIFNYVLKPLSGNGVIAESTAKKLPGEIRNTDFITPIREKNIGEYLELPHNFTVKVDDPDITVKKNSDIAKQIKPIVESVLVKYLSESGILNNQMQNDAQNKIPNQTAAFNNIDPDELQEKIKATIKEWFDDRASNAKHYIDWVNDNNDLENLRLTLFNYWWSTEEVYLYIYNQNGKVYYDVISPLEGYPISNGYEFIEDHEAFVIIRHLSIDRINEYYNDELTEKDRKYLKSLNERWNGSTYAVPGYVYKDIYGYKSEFDSASNQDLVIFSNSSKVKEYVVFYKTQVERKILHYLNPMGEELTTVIDEDDFEFNEELGHLYIEKVWITETWKQVLLGDKYSGIYLKPRPIEVQRYDNNGHNKLPIIGKKGLLNGIYINPIPKRIIPNLALHAIITLHLERQIAKFKGAIEVIPKSMLGESREDVASAMFYKLADNTIIYDDDKVDVQTVVQGYRITGNDALSNYIKTLIDFRQVIKNEAWDMANMNSSRYGNAPASATVTNNKDNIYRAKLGSILMITIFNNILAKLYTAIIEYGKVVHADGVRGSLFNKNTGDVEYFNIGEGELTENKYGIFVTNSVLDYNKLSQYKELAFSAAQNGKFDMASAAIDGDTVSEIRSKLSKLMEIERKFQESLKQQELAVNKQINDDKLKNDELNRNNKLDVVELEQKLITERELKKESIKNNKVTNK